MIICLLGKTGCGKSTTEKALVKRGLKNVVSYTTRNKRENEVDGVHYHFVSREVFEGMAGKGEFVEYVEYNANLYGSTYKSFEEDCVIVTEQHGYELLKEAYGERVNGVYFDIDDELLGQYRKQRKDLDEELLEARNRADRAIAEYAEKDGGIVKLSVRDRDGRSKRAKQLAGEILVYFEVN